MNLYQLHDAGALVLPDELVRLRRARSVLEPLMLEAEAAPRRISLDIEAPATALVKAAMDGTVPDDIGLELVELEERKYRLQQRHAVLERAHAIALSREAWCWEETATLIGDVALAALDSLLERAAEPARLVRGGGVDYRDPASLLHQQKPVQAAYAELAAMAPLHDDLRQAPLEIIRRAPRWDGIADPVLAAGIYRANANGRPSGVDTLPTTGYERAGRFAGFGLVAVRRAVTGHGDVQVQGQPLPLVWAWQPVGHPVERLVAAALDRPDVPRHPASLPRGIRRA